MGGKQSLFEHRQYDKVLTIFVLTDINKGEKTTLPSMNARLSVKDDVHTLRRRDRFQKYVKRKSFRVQWNLYNKRRVKKNLIQCQEAVT